MSRLLWAHGAGIKEWAVVVHALLEGEQILDVRKGGIHEDGRHFACAVDPPLALPHRRAPEARAAEGAVPPLDRSRAGVARRRAIRFDGWADVVRVATITEPEQLDAIASKLIWTADYAASRFGWKKRDPLWVLALRVHRLDEPVTVPWREEYGGCTSWVDLDGLPDDPASLPSEPALSDVAFDARLKGAVESLPELVPPGSG